MTTEQAWEAYRQTPLRYRDGLASATEVSRDYKVFRFHFVGETVGAA